MAGAASSASSTASSSASASSAGSSAALLRHFTGRCRFLGLCGFGFFLGHFSERAWTISSTAFPWRHGTCVGILARQQHVQLLASPRPDEVFKIQRVDDQSSRASFRRRASGGRCQVPQLMLNTLPGPFGNISLPSSPPGSRCSTRRVLGGFHLELTDTNVLFGDDGFQGFFL